MDSKKVEKISKALSDPNRLKILNELKKKRECELYCSEINDIIDLAQPSICHHLKQLSEADLIVSKKNGRNVIYALNNKVFEQYISFLKKLAD